MKSQVKVTIVNAQNEEPLAGATISNSSSNTFIVSDSLGQAVIDKVGDFEIRHLGYNSRNINLKRSDKNLLISLSPNYLLLDAIEVKGFENENTYLSVAGGFSLINKEAINEFSQESLVRAVNTTPGVRMEERSPSSYRLSIRGSLLRAPFGVRNVKVYWNDIPYTDPTGNAYLYFIDNLNVDQIEIIKGPTGSTYGAGMGGAMFLNSTIKNNELGIHGKVGYAGGSFGYHKVNFGVSLIEQNSKTDIGFVSQKTDGYRDHTNSDRKVFQLHHQLKYHANAQLSVQVQYADLFYQLPGGLTYEQYIDNPKQARQRSVDQNALVDHQNLLVGVSNKISWNEHTGNVTSIYFSNGTKENPFITNYELERLGGIGGRTKFYHSTKWLENELNLLAGVEYQYGNFHANNHDNNGGFAGNLRFEDESKINQGFLFGQAEYSTASQWILSFGGSLNFLDYHIERLKEIATDSTYTINRSFQPVFSPRISLVKKVSKNMSIHGSVSRGFSPPTQEEIRTSDGNINKEIEAEKGTNYEVGIRGNGLKNKLMFDLSAFYMVQNNTIVSRIEEGGNSRFENAGNTSQMGIEGLLAYAIINKSNQFVSQLNFNTSFTIHDFNFKNYVKEARGENVDYSGNALTGTAPHIITAGINAKTQPGLYFSANYNFTDEIPLNDANTVYSDAYQLVNLKLGWQKQGKVLFDIFVGVDNVLNETYSLGNDLNAFGDRYFEPSPTRNYYVGVQIDF